MDLKGFDNEKIIVVLLIIIIILLCVMFYPTFTKFYSKTFTGKPASAANQTQHPATKPIPVSTTKPTPVKPANVPTITPTVKPTVKPTAMTNSTG